MSEDLKKWYWTWLARAVDLLSLIGPVRDLIWIPVVTWLGMTPVLSWFGLPLWQAAIIGACGAFVLAVTIYLSVRLGRQLSPLDKAESLPRPFSGSASKTNQVVIFLLVVLAAYALYLQSRLQEIHGELLTLRKGVDRANKEGRKVQGGMEKIRKELDCYLAPRRLTPEQITIIGAYLLEHKPDDIVISWAFHDEGGGDYGKDFSEAFRKGNWRVCSDSPQEDVLPGVTVFYHSSEDTQKADAARRPHDPPNPGEILEKALKRAKLNESVKLRYSSDRNLKYQKYKVTLMIGSLKCKEIAEIEKN